MDPIIELIRSHFARRRKKLSARPDLYRPTNGGVRNTSFGGADPLSMQNDWDGLITLRIAEARVVYIVIKYKPRYEKLEYLRVREPG